MKFTPLASEFRNRKASLKVLVVVFQIFLLMNFMNGQADATPTLSLIPNVYKIHPPQYLFVDVMITGLNSGDTDTLLGAFDLIVIYNANIFDLLSQGLMIVSVGTGLGNPHDPLETIVRTDLAPGAFRLTEISLLEASSATCVFCVGPYLEDLQGDSFRLATLTFYAQGTLSNPPFTGISIFQNSFLLQPTLSDANGNMIDNVVIKNATIEVAEPSGIFLFIVGLFAIGITKRKMQDWLVRPCKIQTLKPWRT